MHFYNVTFLSKFTLMICTIHKVKAKDAKEAIAIARGTLTNPEVWELQTISS